MAKLEFPFPRLSEPGRKEGSWDWDNDTWDAALERIGHECYFINAENEIVVKKVFTAMQQDGKPVCLCVNAGGFTSDYDYLPPEKLYLKKSDAEFQQLSNAYLVTMVGTVAQFLLNGMRNRLSEKVLDLEQEKLNKLHSELKTRGIQYTQVKQGKEEHSTNQETLTATLMDKFGSTPKSPPRRILSVSFASVV